MTCPPRRVACTLKAAGPAPQATMRRCRSTSLNANIRRYSSNDRPHGTTRSSVNINALCSRFRITIAFASECGVDLADASHAQGPALGNEDRVLRWNGHPTQRAPYLQSPLLVCHSRRLVALPVRLWVVFDNLD